MTPEQINIAIAEACGWNDVGFSPSWDAVIGTRYEEGTETYAIVPNYCTDLNAMHEAEKVLTPAQEVLYVHCLSDLVFEDERWDESELCSDNMVYGATASQRAEAFLRALNKWEEAT